MGNLGAIIHFNEFETGIAGNLDWQILGQVIQLGSNKMWAICQ